MAKKKSYGDYQRKYEEMRFYDAHEQQFLDLKKLDEITLKWMQVMRIGQKSQFDPKAGGKEMLIQIGSGANAIIEKKYIPHPYSEFYHSVLHFFDLLIADIDKLRDDAKKSITGVHARLEGLDADSKEAHMLARRLFRDCLRVVNRNYGEVEGIIDVIDPRIQKKIMEERKRAKEAKNGSA